MKAVIRTLFVFFGCCILLSMNANAQTDYALIERNVPYLKFEQRQISYGGYLEASTKSNSAPTLSVAGHQYVGYFDFKLDGSLRGYFIVDHEQKRLLLQIADHQQDTVILECEIAKYAYLEGAMKSITNAWIMDFDHDGIFEVFIQTDLEDYEFPTENAPNISGTTQYRYSLVNGKMVYSAWPADLKLGAVEP